MYSRVHPRNVEAQDDQPFESVPAVNMLRYCYTLFRIVHVVFWFMAKCACAKDPSQAKGQNRKRHIHIYIYIYIYIYISLYNQGPRGWGLGGFTSHPQRERASNSTLDPTKNPHVFELVFKTQKNQKSGSRGPPKNHKIRFRNSQKTLSVKSWFLQYFPCENLECWSLWVENSLQKSIQKGFWKHARKKWHVERLEVTKTNIDRFQNHPKIDESHAPDHLMSILLLPWSSRVPPSCQNNLQGCSRDAKMSPTISKWRHRAPFIVFGRQILEGLWSELIIFHIMFFIHTDPHLLLKWFSGVRTW